MGRKESYSPSLRIELDRRRREAISKELPTAEITDRLNELIEASPSILSLLQALAERRRSSQITDLNQFASAVRASANSEVPRQSIFDVFVTFAQAGIGALEGGTTKREKFHWIYWPHFRFDPAQPSKLKEIKLTPIAILSKDKNEFRRIKSAMSPQAEPSGSNLSLYFLSGPDASRMNQELLVRLLPSIPDSALIAEVERRMKAKSGT